MCVCQCYGLSFTILPYHISNTFTLVNVDIVQHKKTLLYIPHTLLYNAVHGPPFQLYITVKLRFVNDFTGCEIMCDCMA